MRILFRGESAAHFWNKNGEHETMCCDCVCRSCNQL